MSAAFSVPVCRHHPLHVRWMRCVLAVAVVALAPVTVVADEEWKGRLSRPLVVLLGSEDTDPEDSSLPRRPGAMAQGPHRVARGDRFFRTAEAEAERLGISLGWQKRGVPGVGHDNKRMAPAAAALIRDHHQATVR